MSICEIYLSEIKDIIRIIVRIYNIEKEGIKKLMPNSKICELKSSAILRWPSKRWYYCQLIDVIFMLDINLSK